MSMWWDELLLENEEARRIHAETYGMLYAGLTRGTK
ncbi:Hypothetical protein NGAL_HAMBI1145_09950 [Neorhizobium galegae bv. officinalis]|uniref:Uncharacterized protein n=1 Tax=Neorhizobium galegae bv. officinalis TaxID=323656 RepID=A0A0T7FB08_NEOGA|nr:Hypothetical protein NGAL_HAMBI1145_09950 [Neorhizobium galegae bv. officinalis]